MMLSKRLCHIALFSGIALCILSCKKSPVTPSVDELLGPVIWLNAFELSFTASESGENPPGQVLKIKNGGKDTLQYSISDDADWLTVEPGSGSSTGQMVEHTIFINKAGLSAQDAEYEAKVAIICNEAFNNPQTVSVNLRVTTQPPPEIWVSPPEMQFETNIGKSTSPHTLKVKNTGMGTLTYDLASSASWLKVSPVSGYSDGEEKSHTVSVDSRNLPEGNYEGSITVNSVDASNSPRSVRITLEVIGTSPVPVSNEISASCNPASGGTGILVTIPITIKGNSQSISTYGLALTFDDALFQYVGTSGGSLTGSWTVVDGYLSGPGTVTIGGFSGVASSIPVGSTGSIAVVTLRVTGAGYGDGTVSQIVINGYTDDIAGMRPQPAVTAFTYRQ